jgi:putative nucleotidyltransferase with HDIG domain
MAFTPRDLVNAVNGLVSLPELAISVNRMANDPRFSAADIGQSITRDPAMTARLLKIANSPYFGFPSRIETVARAITIIGTQQLRDLITAASVIDVFRDLPNELISMETFWRHSIRCAVIARSLAAYLDEANIERFFTAGLLHDIGYLVLYRELPELSKQTLEHCRDNREIVFIVEQEIIGFDHAAVGGELLRAWNLPEMLVEAVEFHHTPGLAKNYTREADIIHVANYLANTMTANASHDADTPALDNAALHRLNLSDDILMRLLKGAEEQFNETLQVMIYDIAA